MQSIKTKLSSTILVILLLTISIISLLADYFINQQFASYIERQKELRAQVIQSTLSQQYHSATLQWNLNYIHTIGMFSLYEGYIIKVFDKEGKILWDAQAHDMNLCNQIIDEVSDRMSIKYPQIKGEFTSTDYVLIQGNENIGFVSISYFGPFFLNENDFRFLNSLHRILLGVGFVSLIISFVVGHFLSKRISTPILNTVDATKQIANGNYEVRLEEETKISELNMLIGSINHLSTTLETLEKLRKQMTQDVAHELRTPITILHSYLEAILEGIWEPTPERLYSCYDEINRIGKLVNDLENLAKIESELITLNKTSFEMNELVDGIVHRFENELKTKDMEVGIFGPNIRVMADKDRMQQVIVNLLSNAVKYSKEHSKIYFEFFETSNSVGFHITDNGIGISKEELPYIFERFFRADKSRNRLTGGTGIGLAIVKSIVDAHRGKIEVVSEIDQGSRFTLELPKQLY